MNKKLQKQIKAYAGIAGVLLVADKTNGQVVHIDINPDTLLYCGVNPIIFDLNQDGQNDFQFQAQCFTSPTAGSNNGWWHNQIISLNGYNNNQVLKGNSSGCFIVPIPNAFPLNQGDSIPSANQLNNFVHAAKFEDWQSIFITSNLQVCFYAMTPLGQDACIGVKFEINGQFHYGWFKVELLNEQVIIKEYAYQLQPNIPMLACDTPNLATGFSEQNQQQFNFSQQNNSIRISTFQKLNHAEISVYDLLGKETLQQPFEGKEATITIEKKGIYFVEVNSDKGVFRKKVFIY